MSSNTFRNTCLAVLGHAAVGLCVSLALPAYAWGEDGRADGDPDRIKLRFDWPGNFASTVKVDIRYGHQTSARFSEAALEGTYRLGAQKRRGGYLIRFDNADLRTRSLGGRDPLTEFYLRTFAIHPEISVNRAGGTVKFGNFGAHMNAVKARMEKFISELPEPVREPMREMALFGLAPDWVRAEARLYWDLLVGLYAGLELTKGEPVERKTENAIRELNNATVPVIVRIVFTGMAPCSDLATVKKCVHLDVSTRLDPDAVTKAIKSQAKTGLAIGGGDTLILRRYGLSRRIRLLADPETLVPHEWRQKAAVKAIASVNGATEILKQEEETKLTFRRN